VRGIRGAGPGQLLVLDEPTASLPEREVQGLFKLLREIRARDGAVLYVTHRLTELFGLADRVTVLRDGRHVATSPIAKLTHDSLVELMIGSAPSAYYQPPPPPDSEVLLVAESLAGEAITNVGLHVHRGEIVGVTGLIGSGYDQLLGLMFGARRQTHGRLCLGGRVLRPNSPRDAVRAGIAYAPADRRRLSATADWTLRENITLPRISSIGPARWLSKRTEAAAVRPWLSSLNVVPADAERQLKTLSGGNQQKVVLARWLRCEPQILLLDEPTNGVDTGAKQAVYRTLAAAAGNGTGVVIASSDPEELVAVCDRVIVLRRGRVGAVLVGDELTTERVLSETMRAPREPPNLRHSVPSVLKAIKVR